MANIRRELKRLYLRIVTSKGAPHQVAGGVALGVFWGVSPLWGLQTILALISATALNVSRIPAAISVHVSNPLSAPFIYPMTWVIGNLLLKPFVGGARPIPWEGLELSPTILLGFAGRALINMLLGGFVLGAALGLTVYFMSLFGVTRVRQQIRMRKEAKQREKLAAELAGEPAQPSPGIEKQLATRPASNVKSRGSNAQPPTSL